MTSLAVLVSALGIAQIISWGSLFYAIGVLGPAMRREFDVSELYLFGAFTAGLIVQGLIAPAMGRLIDRRGGKVVLSIGSALSIVSLATSIGSAKPPLIEAPGWDCAIAGAAPDINTATEKAARSTFLILQ